MPNTTTAATAVVTFNEIMYHPLDNNHAMEWVEFYNQMSVDIDLSLWRIEGGIEFTFPSGTVLPASQYLVVAADPSALEAGSGAAGVLGPFTKRLSNSGEMLRLRNHNNRIMDELTYSNRQPWPIVPGGSGASLAKRHKFSASSPPENWRGSAQIGGTPGYANFPEHESGPLPVDLLVTLDSNGRWLVPEDGLLGQSWTLPDFNDSAWNHSAASIGFEATPSASENLEVRKAPQVARAYSFEGDLADASGNGFSGQQMGAQFSTFSTNVPARIGFGTSLNFNGVTDQVWVADIINPPAYTLAVWVSVDQVRPSSLIVRTDANGPRTSWSHQLRINASGRFEHYLFDGSPRSIAAATVIQPGVWYHVAGVASHGGPMRIYVNGQPSGGSLTTGNLWAGGNQWRLGTDSGHTPNFFRGRLDEIGIWHEALEPEEIARLADGAPPVLLNGYAGLFSTDVESALFGKNSSLYLRLPFSLPRGAAYDQLTLNVRHDDGFVAYLNGLEVARRHAPEPLLWNSAATRQRSALEAVQLESIDLSPFASNLKQSSNILAVHSLNSGVSDPSFLFAAELSGRQAPPAALDSGPVFNEIAPAGSASFFLELLNPWATEIPLGQYQIVSRARGAVNLPSRILAPGNFLVLEEKDLGFAPAAGDALFLLGPGERVLDGVILPDRLLGRRASDPGGDWFFSPSPTPGLPNQIVLRDEIVINEIMYHPPDLYRANIASNPLQTGEQWIELYNRSGSLVDLSGWQLEDAVRFTFPEGTRLEPDGYLVIARDADALRRNYPDILILGDFNGRLSRKAGRVLLRDADGNPANEVRYHDNFPWPSYADGGGSSLELRDPRADNSRPEAWAPSVEAAKTEWRRYSYRATARNPVYTPNTSFFPEFRLGLLKPGEALIDNISVVEFSPNAPPRELLQNTTFSAGSDKWRLLGNHSPSRVVPDPDDPGNQVLRLVATGPKSYLDNRLETTLKVGGNYVPVVAGHEYEISFDAKWLAGSPQVHTELYYNKVIATTILDRPGRAGTPGRRNSTWLPNAGPTYSGLHHLPAVPDPNDPVTVSITAQDPDGVAELILHYMVNNGPWTMLPMLSSGGGNYSGTIPAQASGAVIQFYVEGTDSMGMASTYPDGGRNSRALIKVDDRRFVANKQTFRIIMNPADSSRMHAFTNLMSDELLGCTIIHDEREVFYNARLRLHGSMFSRNSAGTTGFTVKFPSDHLFRGARQSVIVRRGDKIESYMKHILNQVGGLPANYDDYAHLVSHRSDNLGAARLNMANYDNTYIDSQFENDRNGGVFKLEGIREFLATHDNTPEGSKLPHPIGWIQSYDITDLGDDPEQYRWNIMISNRRAHDDYSRIVAMGKAFSLTGMALHAAAAEVIDVDQWARFFALQTLLGVADIYGVDNPHNVAFYVRPSDGRVVALQNDWGFGFRLGTTASIYGSKNVYKVLGLPGYRRLYQGHLLDIMDSVYHSAYLSRWARHYGEVAGENYEFTAAYADARNASVRRQLAPQIAFEITTNNGDDFTTDAGHVTLEGRGWINVRQIRQESRPEPLHVVWLDERRWQINLALKPGPNPIHLQAYDHRGFDAGQAAIVITSTGAGNLPHDHLRITELMYHPPALSQAEIAAGFTDKNSFEFVELMNTGPSVLPLIGVRFTRGIRFDFTTADVTELGPGRRLLIVRNKAAFEFRYGSEFLIAGEYDGLLDNSGERIRLVDAFDEVIQEFTYSDRGDWPAAADGEGSSLEVLDLEGDYNDPSNWQASPETGGTPGRPPTITPAFSAVTHDGVLVYLKFQAAPDQSYSIHWRPSLTSGDWLLLKTISAEDRTRTEEVTDLLPSGAVQRFYRLATP